MLIPDQFFDRTKGRVSTFFGRGLVAHVGFAHPFCALLERHRVGAQARAWRRRPRWRRRRAQGRHLRVHGRAAVLDAGRVASCIARGAWTSSG